VAIDVCELKRLVVNQNKDAVIGGKVLRVRLC
jgi:hypothetical protein